MVNNKAANFFFLFKGRVCPGKSLFWSEKQKCDRTDKKQTNERKKETKIGKLKKKDRHK